jgi:MFS family permease
MTDAPPTTRPHPDRILAVLLISILPYGVLGSIIIPALPALQHDLDTTQNGVTWVITAYLLSAAAGTAIIGRLGDMYGKKRLLLITLSILMAGTLLAAVADSLAVLIVARAIQGMVGGIFPLAFGIARDELPRERVGHAIGLISASLATGGGVGMVVPGVIVDHLGWHWLFWIPFIVTTVAAFLTWRLVPESPVRVPGRVNWPAGAAMVTGITAVLIGVSQANAWGWGSARTLVLIGAGLAVTALWVLLELRSSEPLIDMGMLRTRGVWTTNVVAFMFGGGMYASIAIYPQLAELPESTGFGYGASVTTTGLYLLSETIAAALFGGFVGRISARYGAKATLIAGCLAMLAAFLVMVIQRDHPIDMIVSAALIGVGLGTGFTALSALSLHAVRPDQTGAASGMNTVVRMIGGAIASQLAVTLIVRQQDPDGLPTTTGFGHALWLLVGFLAVATLASLLVPNLRHAPAAEPERAARAVRAEAVT